MKALFLGILIILLILLQTTFLPINLAFIFILVVSFFQEDLLVGSWLIFLSLLLSLFTSLSLPGILIAYTVAFGSLRLLSAVFPKNKLAKVILVIVALPLSEFSLLFFTGLLR